MSALALSDILALAKISDLDHLFMKIINISKKKDIGWLQVIMSDALAIHVKQS
jgi:hypothetical protein